MSLFPSPITLPLFTPPLISSSFLPLILPYFFSISPCFSLSPYLSLSLSYFIHRRSTHFSRLLLCSNRCPVFLQAALFMPVSFLVCLTIFFASCSPSPCFTLLSSCSLSLSSSPRKIIIYLIFPKCDCFEMDFPSFCLFLITVAGAPFVGVSGHMDFPLTSRCHDDHDDDGSHFLCLFS